MYAHTSFNLVILQLLVQIAVESAGAAFVSAIAAVACAGRNEVLQPGSVLIPGRHYGKRHYLHIADAAGFIILPA